jgi:hypothetical protein
MARSEGGSGTMALNDPAFCDSRGRPYNVYGIEEFICEDLAKAAIRFTAVNVGEF